MAVCLAGCSEYTPPSNSGGETDVTKPGDDNPGGNPDDTADDPFTVSLVYGGLPFIPDEPVSAYWYEQMSGDVYSAPFGEDGIAVKSGIAGEFRVTLSALPVKKDIYGRRIEYTYDPNEYSATTSKKEVKITLYALSPTSGSGSDKYTNSIRIGLDSGNIAAFRATVQYSGQTIFFRYAPTEAGVYAVRTLVDVTANVINPLLDVYYGSVGWVSDEPVETVDGGGVENTFTKNLKWEMAIGEEFLGNGFIFGIRAVGLNANAFPIDIDFVLDKDREFDGEKSEYVEVQPQEEFRQAGKESGTFRYAASLMPNNELNEKLFRLWSKEDGGDGYYHFFEETYDEITGETKITYGATLYAKINKDCAIIETETGTGFMDSRMNRRFGGKDYNLFISQYASYVNGDGAYPVTEELKEFLQGFSNSQSLFNDGDGIAEKWYGYNSSETNQWLFACGYYG